MPMDGRVSLIIWDKFLFLTSFKQSFYFLKKNLIQTELVSKSKCSKVNQLTKSYKCIFHLLDYL